MTAAVAGGRHAARDGSYQRSLVLAAGRAALLVGAAVLLGVVILQATDNGSSKPTVRAVASTTSTTSGRFVNGVTSTTRAATTSSAGAEKKAADLHVIVLNASGKNGAAKAVSDRLKALGYQMADPATAKQVQAATVVQYKPGLDREARTLAKAVSASATIAPLSSPPPGAIPANADLVVVVGSR